MSDATAERLPVRVSGRVGDALLDGEGVLAVLDDAVELATPGGTVTMSFAALDGLRASGREMQLQGALGAITLVADRPIAATARGVVRRACALPELTLSLRGLGTRRASPDSEHDQFFVPLLAARRRAERVSEPQAKLAAFNAAALRGAVERQLREFAARRYPASPPDRRSLEAELSECAERLLASLDALDAAAREVRAAPDAELFARWREWTAALRRVFDCADACWLGMVPVLSEPPRPRRSRLRRLRGWLRLGIVGAAVAAPAGAASQQDPPPLTGVVARGAP